MISQNRLSSLRNFHAQLDRAISEERKRPFPDNDRIKAMKVQKLALKDQIFALTADEVTSYTRSRGKLAA